MRFKMPATPWLAAWFIGVAVLISAREAKAERPPQPKENASLVVDGLVRNVYKKADSDNVLYLVEIEVQGASAGRAPADEARVVVPRTDDTVYVHIFQRRPDAPRVPAAYGHKAIPGEGARIRAYLYPTSSGTRWEGAYPDWFDVLGAAETSFAGDTAVIPTKRMLGVYTAPVSFGTRSGLQITGVVPNSPAVRLGLEPGDVIFEINGANVRNQEQLVAAVARSPGLMKVLIRNVRNGQLQSAEVPLAPPGP